MSFIEIVQSSPWLPAVVGAIVATATSYFMRPMQRPHKMIIDTIEYNLEQLDDLSFDEL